MKRFLVALQFLTILPVRIKSGVSERDLGASLSYFPLVGALIGAALTAVLFLFGFLPHQVVIAIVLIASIVLTGAIHLDGFADTCDGFFGSRSKEKILEIMRDSRIGTMGAVGIFCILLLKFTVLVTIPGEILWRALVIALTFGRWCQCLGCYTSNYAREDGKAEHFIKYVSGREMLIATAFTIGICALLMGAKGIILFAASLPPVFLFIHLVKTKLIGMTGDTIGATNEIAEAVILLLILAYTVRPCLY